MWTAEMKDQLRYAVRVYKSPPEFAFMPFALVKAIAADANDPRHETAFWEYLVRLNEQRRLMDQLAWAGE